MVEQSDKPEGLTPLVLLPGLLCNELLWRHQTGALADIADVTVADLTRDDSIEAMARRVLDGAPEHFALAGMSMGGYVAQEIIRQAPGRVMRLALLDTSAFAENDAGGRRRRIAAVRIGKFLGVTSRLLPQLIHPDRLDDENLISVIQDMAQAVGRTAFVAQQTASMGRVDGFKDLAEIVCDTLVLCGRQDVLTPLVIHQQMAQEIPGARLVIVENCGHLAPLEQPRAVSDVLREWLCNV